MEALSVRLNGQKLPIERQRKIVEISGEYEFITAVRFCCFSTLILRKYI